MLLDAWRLSAGMFTAWPVSPPETVDRRRAGVALLLAPLAVWPLAVGAGLIAWGGRELHLPAGVVGALVVLVVVLGSRAFHIDGLADTADGLTSSYHRERSLAVMKSGDTGPAGVAAVALVLLLQAMALGPLAWTAGGPVLIGLAVAVSRLGPVIACTRGVPTIDGTSSRLGATFGGSLPVLVSAAAWVLGAAVLVAVAPWAGASWWGGLLGVGMAVAASVALALRATRRLGGVNGDIMGACVEVSLALLAVGLIAS